MAGHGHVTPNPDGIVARCGGPRLCRVCASEYLAVYGRPISDSNADYDWPLVAPEWFISSDNSGHEYIVPFRMKSMWNAWRDLPEDDPASWESPDWATRIDGGTPVFTGAWRIE